MIETLYEKRNGLNLKSLGDKPYKNPEYSASFFYKNTRGAENYNYNCANNNVNDEQ